MTMVVGDGRSMSWADRLTLIDRFHPTDEQIEMVFGIVIEEVSTARELMSEGIIINMPTPNVNVITADFFVGVPRDATPLTIPTSTASVDEVNVPQWEVYEPAPKGQIRTDSGTLVDAPPKKRGRGSSKIRDALVSVPTTPTPAEAFAARMDVSINVLRQSKRFISTLCDEDKKLAGEVFVRMDSTTKTLMIWKALPTE